MTYVCGRYPCPSPGCPHCDPDQRTALPGSWPRYPGQFPVAPLLGWECPRCHKVHAPWLPSCDCAPPKREEAP